MDLLALEGAEIVTPRALALDDLHILGEPGDLVVTDRALDFADDILVDRECPPEPVRTARVDPQPQVS
jgi:hypothetical protein